MRSLENSKASVSCLMARNGGGEDGGEGGGETGNSVAFARYGNRGENGFDVSSSALGVGGGLGGRQEELASLCTRSSQPLTVARF